MYRLMLYFLIALVALALLLSLFKLLPFEPLELLVSTAILVVVCWVSNTLFSKLFKVQTNFESVFITALILSLIITPSLSLQGLFLQGSAAFLAMASKYLLAFRKKHIFNPAAAAVVIMGWIGMGGASWWVGSQYMLPVVAVGGFLVAKKINRLDVMLTFMVVSILTSKLNFGLFIYSPLIFFSTVMLVEPLTIPSGHRWRLLYGALVGVLSNIFTYEVALVAGNGVFYIINPRKNMQLELIEKIKLSTNIYYFLFKLEQKLNFTAGQFLQWTLQLPKVDKRGNRRFFTIASSPTEEHVGLAAKFADKGSSFKNTLLSLKEGDIIFAGNLEGDFTLPQDPDKKLVFIAGGIGITPFRSMIKYLIDKKEERDVVLFYAAKEKDEFVFKDIFKTAQKELNIKVVYGTNLDMENIQQKVPDFKERVFYLSGPRSMVEIFEKNLPTIGVLRSQIKTDYFPGYI